MKLVIRAALLTATFLSPVLGASAAVAQTSPAPAPAADAADSRDIIVTARKTEERLQDVPIAITAFGAEEIKAAKIERLSDVAKLTPGLNYTPLFGAQNQLPIIRGAAQTFGQLNVGVFLDGIYLSGKAGVDLELNDLQRIEVIKGPQSALYGRNTFAGAINYVTKRPTAEFSGNAEVTGGTNGLIKGQASISGPLSDTLRFRAGGFYREFDGFYRSGIDGGRVDFAKNYGGIGTLEWSPDSAFTATLRFSYSKEDNGQPASSVIRNNAAPGVPSGGSAAFPRNLIYMGEVPSIPINGVTVNTDFAPGQPSPYGDREESIRGSATLEYDFGYATLTSITAYAKRNAEYTFDGDNTICDRTGGCQNFGAPFAANIPIGSSRFALSSNKGYLRDVSQEIRLGSSGNKDFDWLIGGFYYDNITLGRDRGFSPTSTSGATAYTAFNPNYSYPLSIIDTQSYSLFGSATWHATEQFSIIGELRYEREDQQFTQCPTYYAAGTTPGAGIAQCGAVASPLTTPAFTGSQTVFPSPVGTAPALAFTATRQTFHFATPRVILNYKLEDALVYASYARGAKTGGFNTGLNVFGNQRAYLPETSNNYEIGFKSDLFDRQLRLNVAGFYIDWNNQQAACQNPVSAGGSSTNRTYTCNVAASTIYGIEVETAFRFNEYFSLAGNYAWTHARYDKFVDDSLAANLVLAGLPAINFKGKFLPYVPEHKFVVSPRFNVPVSDGLTIEARGDVQHQTTTYVRADNFQNFGDKTVVDLRLTARFDDFSLQLFADNVFDNKSPVAGVRFFDSVNYSVASPLVTGAQRRELGVALAYSF